ncbi:hypothetical protein MMC07_008729 [Pseudocyphellaria aurata]|nr:hypothetical protein [Pseudocyphellaria aurata]
MNSCYGLEWKNELLGPRPIWTADPSLEVIAKFAHLHLNLSPEEIARTTTEFQCQGAFNKLYAVESPRGSFFMRISLPVDPGFKTMSEVATIALLQSHTSVPVPQIIASSPTSDNELKFEWILMKRVPGLPLADIWVTLPWDAKVSCVNDVAGVMAQLFQLRYDSIGNLFNVKDLPTVSDRKNYSDAAEPDLVVLDRIVSMVFFWNTHLKSNVPRGPFASSKDWLNARFQLMEEDCRRVLESQDADEDDIEDMEAAQKLLERLRIQLHSFFPSNSNDREEFALHHHDISQQNLIVDSKGKLQALVDWESVSVMPLWKGCQIPSFIDTCERIERPNPDNYTKDTEGGDGGLYEEHLHEFECTCLRAHFLAEMARLAPLWIVEYENSAPKVDFDLALENCDDLFGTGMVRTWLDRVEAGDKYRRLEDIWPSCV